MAQITKKAIADAFINQLKKKPFNKITIGGIADECGISRMTFYYHFEDIYDMLDWALQEKLQKGVEADLSYENWRSGVVEVFERMLSEKEFFLKVFPAIDLRRVEYYLMGIAHNLIMPMVDRLSTGINVSENSKIMIARVYEFSIVGLFLSWLSDGMKEQPEEIVMRYATAFRGSLKAAITNCAEQEE